MIRRIDQGYIATRAKTEVRGSIAILNRTGSDLEFLSTVNRGASTSYPA